MRCLASQTLQHQSCQTRLTRRSSSRSEQSTCHTTADRLSVLLAFLSDTRMRRHHLFADASALPWITAAVQGGLTCSLQVRLNAGRQHRQCHGSDIRCLSYILSLTAPASCKARRLVWRCLLAASHCKIPLHPGVRPSCSSVGLGQSAGHRRDQANRSHPQTLAMLRMGCPFC